MDDAVEDDHLQDPDFNIFEDDRIQVKDIREELRADKAVRVSDAARLGSIILYYTMLYY